MTEPHSVLDTSSGVDQSSWLDQNSVLDELKMKSWGLDQSSWLDKNSVVDGKSVVDESSVQMVRRKFCGRQKYSTQTWRDRRKGRGRRKCVLPW